MIAPLPFLTPSRLPSRLASSGALGAQYQAGKQKHETCRVSWSRASVESRPKSSQQARTMTAQKRSVLQQFRMGENLSLPSPVANPFRDPTQDAPGREGPPKRGSLGESVAGSREWLETVAACDSAPRSRFNPDGPEVSRRDVDPPTLPCYQSRRLGSY